MAKQDIEKIASIVYDNEFNKDEERRYPEFDEAMKNIAVHASMFLRKDITPYDVAIIMTCLKLDRDGFFHKKDNLYDAMAYLGNAFKFCEDNGEQGY